MGLGIIKFYFIPRDVKIGYYGTISYYNIDFFMFWEIVDIQNFPEVKF